MYPVSHIILTFIVLYPRMPEAEPLPRGNRVGIVTLSGGAGVMAADACFQSGLHLAELDYHTLQKIGERMPSWATVGHPVDIEPLTETVNRVEAYKIAFEAVLSDKNVDLCLFIMGTMRMSKADVSFLGDIKNAYPKKPMAVCVNRKTRYLPAVLRQR